MGRVLVSIGFILICGLSVYYFQSMQDRDLKEKLQHAADGPRLWMEAVQVFSYDRGEVKAFFSAGQAQFIEPNVIEMYGRLQGYKIADRNRELVSAESGQVTLAQKGIAQIMNNATIEKAQLENQVHVENGTMQLDTPFADYARRTETLTSHMPVTVRGPTYRLVGKEGFEYDLKTKRIQLQGPIKGTLEQLPGVK